MIYFIKKWNAFPVKAFFVLLLMLSCKQAVKEAYAPEVETLQLFNGKDLTGWIPKITGHRIGENFANTFQVKDSLLVVDFSGYETFNNQFGHLFYEKPFSAYYLTIEYRFLDGQAPGGPEWAYRNSGVMLHSQEPLSMGINQDFPISIEAQFLGGDGSGERPTSNLCTPGTHVKMADTLFTPHCINSNSKTYHNNQWVRASFLVLKDSLIQHYLEGKVVLEYTKPQIGGGNVSNFDAMTKRDGKTLTGGYLALQSESHPIEFKKVELVDLEPFYTDKAKLKEVIDAILKDGN